MSRSHTQSKRAAPGCADGWLSAVPRSTLLVLLALLVFALGACDDGKNPVDDATLGDSTGVGDGILEDADGTALDGDGTDDVDGADGTQSDADGTQSDADGASDGDAQPDGDAVPDGDTMVDATDATDMVDGDSDVVMPPTMQPQIIALSNGGGVLSDGSNRLVIGVGSPQPMGTMSDGTVRLTLGPVPR